MRDLTHYFMDVEKPSEESKITSNDLKNVSPENPKVKSGTPKKRGRVKIKISQKKDEERICHIVESKHDLVDKTPSPFTIPKDKKIISFPGETPKRSGMMENGKIVEIEDEDLSDFDCSGGRIFSPQKLKEKSEKNEEICEIDNSRRESSNAFQVLMTRSKPIQYLPPKNLSPEAEILETKKNQEIKSKLKKNKEKLIELADKKGYTKRKLAEAEEEEKIEKRLENRAKVFKKLKRDEESPNQNQRQSGGLHDYFSKTTAEEREKQRLRALSTVTVKADIHGSEVLQKDSTKILLKSKKIIDAVKIKTRKVLAAIDDIQVLRSETPSPPPVIIEPPPPIEVKSIKKTKWSLRINLSESEELSKDEEKEFDDVNRTKNPGKPKKNKKKEKNKNNSKKNEEKEIKINPEIIEDSVELLDPPETSKNDQKLVRCDSAPLPPRETSSDLIIMPKILSQPSPDIEIIGGKSQKLAPIFMKRQKLDPEVLAARKNFLYSKSPEDLKKKVEKKIQIPSNLILPFPSISHVTQLSPIKNDEKASSPLRIPSRVPWIHVPTFNSSDFKSLNDLNVSEILENSQKNQKIIKSKQEDILEEIEGRCADAKEIWSAITLINNQSTKESPRRRGKKRKSLEKNKKSGQFEDIKNLPWTQKYRPLSAKQIVGNEDAAIKLKTWLEAWRTPVKDDYSSGDEFYSSDNSFVSNLETNQVAVLLGPHGSGKTASVYAIAEELGYTVLELNASSKRTGKKIFKDFEEATKSHRIKKSDLQAQIVPIAEKMPQNSLILVEDVDLVFDEDDGFISAIFQLSTNTKRPIVMSCRGSCTHLSRMAPQQMKIYFQGIFGDRVRALLELITLAEAGTRLPSSCLDKLLMKGDLRKALLQLQYLVLSGNPEAREVPSRFGETLWQDVKSNIYKPAIKCEKKMEKKKEKIKEDQGIGNNNLIETLSDDLTTISLLSNFVEIDDQVLNFSEVKFEPSISLIENEDMYCRNNSQIVEISEWLKSKVMNKYKGNLKETKQNSDQFFMMKKELNSSVNLALSQVSLNNLDSYAMRTDYLPTVRNICRAEEAKITNNLKRGNRFFHYLQTLRLPSTSTKSNILAAACKMLRDENPKFDG